VSGFVSAPIYVIGGQANTIVLADGCSFPKRDLSGYVQTYGINDTSSNGLSKYRDIVTTLTNNAPTQVLEVIARDKFDQV
jgi:hypothetical protein